MITTLRRRILQWEFSSSNEVVKYSLLSQDGDLRVLGHFPNRIRIKASPEAPAVYFAKEHGRFI